MYKPPKVRKPREKVKPPVEAIATKSDVSTKLATATMPPSSLTATKTIDNCTKTMQAAKSIAQNQQGTSTTCIQQPAEAGSQCLNNFGSRNTTREQNCNKIKREIDCAPNFERTILKPMEQLSVAEKQIEMAKEGTLCLPAGECTITCSDDATLTKVEEQRIKLHRPKFLKNIVTKKFRFKFLSSDGVLQAEEAHKELAKGNKDVEIMREQLGGGGGSNPITTIYCPKCNLKFVGTLENILSEYRGHLFNTCENWNKFRENMLNSESSEDVPLDGIQRIRNPLNPHTFSMNDNIFYIHVTKKDVTYRHLFITESLSYFGIVTTSHSQKDVDIFQKRQANHTSNFTFDTDKEYMLPLFTGSREMIEKMEAVALALYMKSGKFKNSCLETTVLSRMSLEECERMAKVLTAGLNHVYDEMVKASPNQVANAKLARKTFEIQRWERFDGINPLRRENTETKALVKGYNIHRDDTAQRGASPKQVHCPCNQSFQKLSDNRPVGNHILNRCRLFDEMRENAQFLEMGENYVKPSVSEMTPCLFTRDYRSDQSVLYVHLKNGPLLSRELFVKEQLAYFGIVDNCDKHAFDNRKNLHKNSHTINNSTESMYPLLRGPKSEIHRLEAISIALFRKERRIKNDALSYRPLMDISAEAVFKDTRTIVSALNGLYDELMQFHERDLQQNRDARKAEELAKWRAL